MITRIYIKNLLSFKEISLELNRGLTVITGASGCGKSIFINSILANFGITNQEAKLSEIELQNISLDEESIELFELEDEIIVKSLKRDRVRYFLNEQRVSKKRLKEIFKRQILYLSVRDKSGISSSDFLKLIDSTIKDKRFLELKGRYSKLYDSYMELDREIKSKRERIKEIQERVDFLKYEIDRLEKINPKVGEYEELLKVKRQLSRIDKIQEISKRVNEIFNYEDSVYELLSILDRDDSYFSDAMNTLRGDLEEIETLTEELNEVNVKELLDRLSELDLLNKRFGSIQNAIDYLERIKGELESFNLISSDLDSLSKEIGEVEAQLIELAKEISNFRRGSIELAEAELKPLLADIKLPPLKFEFRKRGLNPDGFDEVTISINGSGLDSLSGGEFNRVRLALLTVTATESQRGVIFLDEIDANVSGDESIAISNMISRLSKSFQIFAISHQPHLSSKADTHILVTKKDGVSRAKILTKEEQIREIARIIGGESFQEESIQFAQKLLNN